MHAIQRHWDPGDSSPFCKLSWVSDCLITQSKDFIKSNLFGTHYWACYCFLALCDPIIHLCSRMGLPLKSSAQDFYDSIGSLHKTSSEMLWKYLECWYQHEQICIWKGCIQNPSFQSVFLFENISLEFHIASNEFAKFIELRQSLKTGMRDSLLCRGTIWSG